MEGFIGEIRLFAGTYAPANWALCDGSLLPIASPNIPLFAVIGAFYGGNGRDNFALPDLRGRAAIGAGQGSGLSPYTLGQAVGTEQVPTQSIQVSASGGPNATVNAVAAGSGNNVQPVLGLNYIICVNGIFPSRSS